MHVLPHFAGPHPLQAGQQHPAYSIWGSPACGYCSATTTFSLDKAALHVDNRILLAPHSLLAGSPPHTQLCMHCSTLPHLLDQSLGGGGAYAFCGVLLFLLEPATGEVAVDTLQRPCRLARDHGHSSQPLSKCRGDIKQGTQLALLLLEGSLSSREAHAVPGPPL